MTKKDSELLKPVAEVNMVSSAISSILSDLTDNTDLNISQGENLVRTTIERQRLEKDIICYQYCKQMMAKI